MLFFGSAYIVIPQAFKNVLPSLANEFIVLLKETSVSGYVSIQDLTKGGDIIRGVTYSAFMPLIAVALIYLAMVMFFTWLVGKLEKRLRASDGRDSGGGKKNRLKSAQRGNTRSIEEVIIDE